MSENIEQKKWILSHGIHCGTITSRDSFSRWHDSYDEAYQDFLKQKEWYKSIGYVIWFADIIAPDGTKTHLESNSNYNNMYSFSEQKSKNKSFGIDIFGNYLNNFNDELKGDTQ